MKNLIFGIISILLLVSVIAQDDATSTSSDSKTNIPPETDETDVGIAPDSAFYGLENAFKKISLALTFSKEIFFRSQKHTP